MENKSKNNILIVEPDPSGHHISLYTKLIIQAIVNNYEIHLLTSNRAKDHVSIKNLNLFYNNSIKIHYINDIYCSAQSTTIQLLKYQFLLYFTIKSKFIALNSIYSFQYVIVPTFDHFDKILSLLGSPFKQTSFFGIYMSPKFHRNYMGIGNKSRSDSIYSFFFKRLLNIRSLKYILIVDPLFNQFLKINNYKYLNKIIFFNEPINLIGDTNKLDSRYSLNIPIDSKVILIYGHISKRKGIIQMIQTLKLLSNKFLLLIAGTINNDIKDFLESSEVKDLIEAKKLIISDGFKNEEEQYKCFISSDLVSVAYENTFTSSSGVYYQACDVGLPVLVNKYGLLNWLVQNHENGISTDINDLQLTCKLIEDLFNDNKYYDFLSKNSFIVAKKHSPEQFIKSVLKALNPYL